jgi:hypothetical protein
VGTHFKNGHTFTTPLIEHWDGHRWHVVSRPSGRLTDAFFRGVTAIATDDVWAVGQRIGRSPVSRDPLAAHWDGTTWDLVRVPKPDGQRSDLLASVSASGSNDVWAVGQVREGYAPQQAIASQSDQPASSTVTLSAHFDGTKWKIVRSIDRDGNSSFFGVSAFAQDDVWAAGWGGLPSTSLAEHWTGESWSIADTADRPQFDALYGLDGTSSTNLWAVGANQTPEGESLTLAEHYNGSSWALSGTPSPGTADRLLGVAVSGGEVWAVGATGTAGGGADRALVLHHC